jgi:hypothetical protein
MGATPRQRRKKDTAMDHERYPYYFEDSQGGIRAVHLEHARESFLSVATGILAAVRRIVTLIPTGSTR